MNPDLAMKAARLCVFARADGSYQVAGDSGTYDVRRAPFLNDYSCSCRAGRGCSHILSVRFHLERQKAET